MGVGRAPCKSGFPKEFEAWAAAVGGDLMDRLRSEMILYHCHAYIQSELAHLDVEFEEEVFSKGKSLAKCRGSESPAQGQPGMGQGNREA